MKKGAVSILFLMCLMLNGCSMVLDIDSVSPDNKIKFIQGKDYGQNLNPLDSLTKKFI